MNRLGALSPSLEGMEWRAAEREQGDRAEVARERFDDAPAPAVERMVGAVGRFGARRKYAPPLAARKTGENNRANVGKWAGPVGVLKPQRAARDEAGAGDGGQYGFKPYARHENRLTLLRMRDPEPRGETALVVGFKAREEDRSVGL